MYTSWWSIVLYCICLNTSIITVTAMYHCLYQNHFFAIWSYSFLHFFPCKIMINVTIFFLYLFCGDSPICLKNNSASFTYFRFHRFYILYLFYWIHLLLYHELNSENLGKIITIPLVFVLHPEVCYFLIVFKIYKTTINTAECY